MTRDGTARGSVRRPWERDRSLLGTYPVPTLRLVGSARPASQHATAPWLPALQYGIDYSFSRRLGRTPVRWWPDAVITVRLAGVRDRPLADQVAEVTGEIRVLSGLDLRAGPPLGGPIDLGNMPEQEIHVSFLSPADARQARQDRHGQAAGPGDAWCEPGGKWYRHGWVIVEDGPARGDAPAAGDPAITLTASRVLLRHHLCHALGLGHAARPSLLMHRQVPVRLDGYGRGDRHGLALLGRAGPESPRSPFTTERTLPCG